MHSDSDFNIKSTESKAPFGSMKYDALLGHELGEIDHVVLTADDHFNRISQDFAIATGGHMSKSAHMRQLSVTRETPKLINTEVTVDCVEYKHWYCAACDSHVTVKMQCR